MVRDMLLKERPHEDLLVEAIRDLCGRMRSVDSRFEEETDEDLLEAYIWERLALQAHYRYLTRELRRREGVL